MIKSVWTKLLCAIVLAIFGTGSYTFAYAFSIARMSIGPLTFTGESNHESITSEGLLHQSVKSAAYIKASGKNIEFADFAVDSIVEANRKADEDNYANPRFHFDNELFVESNFKLKEARAIVINAAKAGQYVRARQVLGTALHTLQDFYSHSTWIEKHGVTAHENQAIGTYAFNLKGTDDTTCTEFTLLNSPSTPITSGYYVAYPPSAPLLAIRFSLTVLDSESYFTNPYLPYSLKQGKCVHGSGLPNSHAEGKGINKDSSARAGFAQAKAAAVASTATYVASIIKELADGDDDAAICGLLGQQNNPACIYLLVIQPNSLSPLEVGATKSLTVTARDKKNSLLPVDSYKFSWFSSNPAVAAVERYGSPVALAANGPGTAQITIGVEGSDKVATISITVAKSPTDGLCGGQTADITGTWVGTNVASLGMTSAVTTHAPNGGAWIQTLNYTNGRTTTYTGASWSLSQISSQSFLITWDGGTNGTTRVNCVNDKWVIFAQTGVLYVRP